VFFDGVRCAAWPVVKAPPKKTKRQAAYWLIFILHSKDAEYKCAAITTQDSAFTNTKATRRKRVLSPLEHVPKRHKASVGDKKLSSAPAPEQVPELQLFANLAIEEGAPPLSYWEGLYDQLKKVRCELD
jgi:hypothetical protein